MIMQNLEEKFTRTVEELRERTVIVEGKKDVKALRALGLKRVIPINGKPLIKLVEDDVFGKSETVILTDFDPEGRRIAAGLIKLLHAYGIPVNTGLRRAVMEIMASEYKNRVENFSQPSPAGYKKNRGDNHVKIGTSFYKIHNKSKHKGKGCRGKARCNRCYFWTDRRPFGH